jgi:uncharacterized protein YodC (DUF2158 family)
MVYDRIPMRLSARPVTSHCRWLLAGAVLVVLAAQWLALVHAVVHGRGPAPATVLELRADAPTLVRLVAGHDAGTVACQWLDQLAQATPVFEAPASAVVLLLPADLPRVALPAPRPTARAPYDARAPPVRA